MARYPTIANLNIDSPERAESALDKFLLDFEVLARQCPYNFA